MIRCVRITARAFAMSRVYRVISAFILLLAALLTAIPVSGPDVIMASAVSGGAPPVGSGTVRSSAEVRVLDGNTIITWINGKQTAVRVAGLDVAPYTTPCGAAATKQLWKLTKGGELTLEEDNALAFDAQGLRVYHALARDGRAISQELVKAGVAKVNSKAESRHLFIADEAQARTTQQGCLWSHGSPTAGAVDTARIEAAMGLDNGFRAAPAAPTASDASPLSSSVLPTGFSVQTVAAGIDQPTGFAFAPDGRIFILAKHGLVWVVKNGVLLPTPLIDLHTSVNDYGDHGLLGIAVDPTFAINGFLYLLYTAENDLTNPTGPKTARLARYTVTGDVADPVTQQVLLGTALNDATHPSCENLASSADCIPTDDISHSIGSVRFASDGTLFVSTGDGASFNFVDDRALRSQNIDSLAGKMLHITKTGQGIATNPFADGDLSHNRSKVWAYGFRNPFRFTLRPGTDVPYVGDVGWDTWEEINVATRGGNFGWPCYEGKRGRRATRRKWAAKPCIASQPGR